MKSKASSTGDNTKSIDVVPVEAYDWTANKNLNLFVTHAEAFEHEETLCRDDRNVDKEKERLVKELLDVIKPSSKMLEIALTGIERQLNQTPSNNSKSDYDERVINRGSSKVGQSAT